MARRRRIQVWLTQARAFAVRYLRQPARSPAGLVFLIAWPAFWYRLVAHLLFGGSGAPAAVVTAKAAFAVSFGLFGAFTVSLTGVVESFTADVGGTRPRRGWRRSFDRATATGPGRSSGVSVGRIGPSSTSRPREPTAT